MEKMAKRVDFLQRRSQDGLQMRSDHAIDCVAAAASEVALGKHVAERFVDSNSVLGALAGNTVNPQIAYRRVRE